MACRGYATSDLQDVLGTAIERLSALRSGGIAAALFLDEDDADDIEALAVLCLEIARALDPIFHEIAYRGGLGSRSRASIHAAYVSTAIAGNLDFELRERAESIAARRPAPHPNDEHRLMAVNLGVGSRW
jgi:hypothetical protein